MESKGNLYALLIGINTYQNYPKQLFLTACHNDVHAMIKLLNESFIQQQFSALHIHPPLLDNKATKQSIIQAFQKHFALAQKGDTVLFYFSGHGIREKTNIAAFNYGELDDAINSLVCYDSDFSIRVGEERNNGNFLSDKELRF